MTTPYLDLEAFKDHTLMPATDVDSIEAVRPGWLLKQLAIGSSRINAVLAKRYVVPFGTPCPEIVADWLARLVTLRAYLKRGVDPTDQQFSAIKESGDAVLGELEKAADADKGMYELPLRADLVASGVSQGNPRGYTEASPYVGFDVQVDAARDEDASRGGTHG